jgi:phosphohistidine phosphatase
MKKNIESVEAIKQFYMKRIIFIRHGKAEDLNSDISDFERSLTTKGKRELHDIALKLHEKQPSIDLFLSSPAFRAIETAYILAGYYGSKLEDVHISDNLYYRTNTTSFISYLRMVEDDKNNIAIIGHNPSITTIAEQFSKDPVDFIPKSGVVCLSFNSKIWATIKEDQGKLEYIINPR